MRHRVSGRKLGRTAEHRRALMRNLVTELFRHERIETTEAKAKEARRYAERMITFAKQGGLHARRQVDGFIMSPEVTQKLFGTIASWYTDRNGGYTRVLKTRHRLGDGGEMALLELVKSEDQMREERKRRHEEAARKEADAETEAKTKDKAKKA